MTEFGRIGCGSTANQDSLAALLLTSRLASEGVKPFTSAEYWQRSDLASRPSALFDAPPGALCSVHGLAEEMASRIAALFDRAIAMAFEVDRLKQSGIHTITPFDEHYPCLFRYRLKEKAPVVLHAAGPLDLFDRPGLGVVGSRDIGEEGAEVAKNAARLATRLGLPVVSGGARGVDQLAMNAAVGEEGAAGAAIGFLADSMERQLKRPDNRRVILDGRALLCTPYKPDARFTAGTAMGRNKLIYAGSLNTLVVASDIETGGTWAGAVESLKHGFGPVAVWRGPGEGPGNERLEQMGAMPVGSLDELGDLLIKALDKPMPDGQQMPPEGEARLPFSSEFSSQS
ncbi:DNA-processing protein DprA [Candidatus Poriferisocius sp.]|uniref:DNA-processing protein DprA n=1 Tax=Candidatus Poriferisocius sp. TaxID=3101276 RepID=UPI003B01CFA7